MEGAEDAEFREYLAQNLAAETERFREDLRMAQEAKMNQWSKHFWSKIRTIIKSKQVKSDFPPPSIDQFKKLEFLCLEEYEEALQQSLSLNEIQQGDRKLLDHIELIDERFRVNLEFIDEAMKEEIVAKRDLLRLRLVNLWRMKKRALLDVLYTNSEVDSRELMAKIDSLSYEDFQVKDNGSVIRYFC